MKITKTLIVTTLICSFFLVGCNKTEELVDVQPMPNGRQAESAVGTQDITEDEKIAEMIRLIEEKEANE